MSILDSLKYDLKAICATGDIGISVTYVSTTQLQVATYVILTKEASTTEDGMVLGSYLSAIILIDDVPAPEKGDTFHTSTSDPSNYVNYKVLEIIKRDDAHTTAVVESI